MPDSDAAPVPRSNRVFPLDPSHLLSDDGKKHSIDLDSIESVTISDSKWSEDQWQNKWQTPCEEKGFFASYACLYSFADRFDYKLMAFGFFCALLQATIPPFVWLIMGNFITVSINREELMAMNSTDSSQVDEEFSNSATPAFVAMIVLSVSMFFAAFFQRLSWEVSGIRQTFRIKTAYIRKLLHMDISWLESRQSGQVASMLHDKTDSIYDAIADHLPMVLFILTYLVVNIGLCFYIQWDVTLLMCTIIPLIILSRILFSKWFAKTLNEENNLQNKITNLVNETFSNIRTVISFAAQKMTINQFEKLSHSSNRLTEARLRSSTVYDSLTQILLTEMVFTVALCYGIWRVGDTNPGALCALAVNMLYMCVTTISIGFHLNGANAAKSNGAQMAEIFRESPKIEKDRCYFLAPIPYQPASKHRRMSMKFMGKGAIELKKVRFTYPSRPDTEILKGVDLSIEAGEKIAICGPSGSGKSTITALLLRFYDPSSGSITLDGDNLKNMCPDELRSHMALVSQEPVLFDGTIADNIQYGRLDATQSEIITAAKKVGAWDFISKLPNGILTRVGDRGLQLSGGQKQRVAIARAVLRRPTVLIFDEATSALDNIHEEEVTQAIDLASEGLTTISIAHRLSTVRHADRIIVLEMGQIVEMGTPEDLLEVENGKFRKMWIDQGLDKHHPQPMMPRNVISEPNLEDLDEHEHEETKSEETTTRPTLNRGQSYTCSLYNQRDKLTKAVRRKRKGHRPGEHNFQPLDNITPEEDQQSHHECDSNWTAIKELIRGYRSGYSLLAGAIPITVIRAIFYLLICFEVSSMLELSVVPEHDRPQQILIIGAMYTALIIIKTIFEALGRLFIALYGHGFACNMRREMFRQVLRHGCAYFDEERNTPGKLVYKIITDSSTLNKVLEQKLDMLIPAVVCSIFSIIVSLVINWKMALLCSFQFPVYFMIQILQLKEGTKRRKKMEEEETKAASLVADVLNNMTTIKAYNLQEHFFTVFESQIEPLAKAMKRQSVISSFAFACQYSFTYILIALTLYFGKVMMQANEISIFDYMRSEFGANFFSQLIASVSDFSRARASAQSVMRVLREQPHVDNLSEEGLRPKIEGKIEFSDIRFSYPSRREIPILKGISIEIRAGEMIGIVGPSGSGKSSLFHILQRLYAPTEGDVILDGCPVQTINPAYLRKNIVSVGQEPSLFSFTIKENITYGLLEHEYTMEDVFTAAKVAKIHDFIVSLPQGYETEVGEFGAQLSGGQKQRIAIARALVRKPSVLLCDEATAALDSLTERAVREAYLAQKSVTNMAHRLSSIKHMQRIYVVVDGRVAEEGDHDFLMNRKGVYYDMVTAV